MENDFPFTCVALAPKASQQASAHVHKRENIASAGAAILCIKNAMSALVSEIVWVNYAVRSVLAKKLQEKNNRRKLRIIFPVLFSSLHF